MLCFFFKEELYKIWNYLVECPQMLLLCCKWSERAWYSLIHLFSFLGIPDWWHHILSSEEAETGALSQFQSSSRLNSQYQNICGYRMRLGIENFFKKDISINIWHGRTQFCEFLKSACGCLLSLLECWCVYTHYRGAYSPWLFRLHLQKSKHLPLSECTFLSTYFFTENLSFSSTVYMIIVLKILLI